MSRGTIYWKTGTGVPLCWRSPVTAPASRKFCLVVWLSARRPQKIQLVKVLNYQQSNYWTDFTPIYIYFIRDLVLITKLSTSISTSQALITSVPNQTSETENQKSSWSTVQTPNSTAANISLIYIFLQTVVLIWQHWIFKK